MGWGRRWHNVEEGGRGLRPWAALVGQHPRVPGLGARLGAGTAALGLSWHHTAPGWGNWGHWCRGWGNWEHWCWALEALGGLVQGTGVTGSIGAGNWGN